jgi:NTE family protein
MKSVADFVPLEPRNFILNASFETNIDNLDDYYFPHKGFSIYSDLSFMRNYKYKTGYITPCYTFKYKGIIPINRRFVFVTSFNSRSLYGNKYSQYKMNFVGGTEYSLYFNNQFPFAGLAAVEPFERYLNVLSITPRYNIFKKNYIGITLNALRSNHNLLDLKNNLFVFGVGLSYQIKTNMGPLDVTVGYSDYMETPTFSANLGYWF